MELDSRFRGNDNHRAVFRPPQYALAFVCILALSFSPAATLSANAPSVTEILQGILHDQKAIATSPLRADKRDASVWVPASLVATGLAVRWNTRMSVDERVAAHFADVSGMGKSVMRGVTELGNAAVPFGLSAAGYALGRWGENVQLQSFSARWFEALVDVSVWGEIIKITAGRSRPESAPFRSDFLGPAGYFGNSGKNSSFVSGHTTASFASAAVFSREFPTPWVAVPAYLLAGGVGFSRIYLDQHWTSDVIAGAALGQSIGSLVENRHRKGDPAAAGGAWMPWIQGGTVGLAWTRAF